MTSVASRDQGKETSDPLEPTEDLKVEGDETDYSGYFKGGLWVGMAMQSIYGLIAFIYIIMQLTSLGAFYYAVTYTSFLGALYLLVIGIAIFFPTAIHPYREAAIQFLTYYTLMLIVTLTWMWTFFNFHPSFNIHNNKNQSPGPGDVAFMPYLGLNIWIIVSSMFYLMYGFEVLNKRPSTAGVKASWVGIDSNRFGSLSKAMQVFAFLALFSGMLYGLLQFFWLLGFNSGNLWGPIILYILFSVFFIIEGFLYFYISWNADTRSGSLNVLDRAGEIARGVGRTLRTAWLGHWEEIDATQFFMLVFWAINFGFWVRIWTVNGVDYDAQLKFGGAPSTVYYSLVANAIIASVFVPMFGYYMITFACYTQYVVSNEMSYSMFHLGYASIFASAGIKGVAVQRTTTENKIVEEVFKSPSANALKRLLIFFFFLGFLYVLITSGIVLGDLMGNHYLNARFKNWEWSVFFISGGFWLVYLVYALIVGGMSYKAAGTEAGFKNAMQLCALVRPLVTLFFVIFMIDFGDGIVFNKYGSGSKIPRTIVDDPTLGANVQYWSVLLITFGMLMPAVVAYKDILATLVGVMFVMTEDGKTKAKQLFEDKQSQSHEL